MGCHALLQGIFPTRWKGTGIKARSPALLVDSLLSEPPGKPMNTRVGSLSLLQGIFPTQELNQGLLHCRQILYQLSNLENIQCELEKDKHCAAFEWNVIQYLV